MLVKLWRFWQIELSTAFRLLDIENRVVPKNRIAALFYFAGVRLYFFAGTFGENDN